MSLGNRVWIDQNNNGVIDGGESGAGNVSLSLYIDANQDGVPDSAGAIATTTTDANGYYIFDGLTPGSYLIGVDASNFQSGGPLAGYLSSTGSQGDNQTDNNDSGIDGVDPTFGILSTTVVMTQDSETTSEVDLGPEGNGRNGETANNSDLTIDFGFYQNTITTIITTPTPGLDILVTKSVQPAFVQAGDIVTWTIMVQNLGSAPQDLAFVDHVDSRLIILSATAEQGSASVLGQDVNYQVVQLPANGIDVVTIQTQIRNDVEVPFVIENAVLNSSATTTSLVELPSTGESAPWREILAGLIGLLVLSGAGLMVVRSRKANQSA